MAKICTSAQREMAGLLTMYDSGFYLKEKYEIIEAYYFLGFISDKRTASV